MCYISKFFKEKYPPLKMDSIGIKKIYSTLKIDNVTFIKLTAFAKQHDIKGYYKLRKAELIDKLEAHPDVTEQVLIPRLKIPRNTTRSVNTSATLDQPISDDKTPVLQPTPSRQKFKDFGNWLLDFIPQKPKVVNEALESFINLIRKLYSKREISFEL